MAKLRYAAIGAALFFMVAVDFSSKILSIAADGLLLVVAAIVAYPLFKKKK